MNWLLDCMSSATILPKHHLLLDHYQKSYGQNLPDELGMYRLEVEAGRSTQATLLGRDDITIESVYLSNNLVQKLHIAPTEVIANHVIRQPALFEF